MSFQDFEERVKKIKDPLRKKIIQYREPDYPIHEKILYGLISTAMCAAFVLMIWYMDKDPERLSVSLRTTFIQLCKVALIWTPIIVYDKATRSKTLQGIMATPYERALFLGLMAIATAIVAAWGSI